MVRAKDLALSRLMMSTTTSLHWAIRTWCWVRLQSRSHELVTQTLAIRIHAIRIRIMEMWDHADHTKCVAPRDGGVKYRICRRMPTQHQICKFLYFIFEEMSPQTLTRNTATLESVPSHFSVKIFSSRFRTYIQLLLLFLPYSNANPTVHLSTIFSPVNMSICKWWHTHLCVERVYFDYYYHFHLILYSGMLVRELFSNHIRPHPPKHWLLAKHMFTLSYYYTLLLLCLSFYSLSLLLSIFILLCYSSSILSWHKLNIFEHFFPAHTPNTHIMFYSFLSHSITHTQFNGYISQLLNFPIFCYLFIFYLFIIGTNCKYFFPISNFYLVFSFVLSTFCFMIFFILESLFSSSGNLIWFTHMFTNSYLSALLTCCTISDKWMRHMCYTKMPPSGEHIF